MTTRGHDHPEAFCNMKYSSRDGQEVEWIWNSRDGVTPFCVSSRSGIEMTHVDWSSDIYDPKYKPQPGDRIFVDATRELVEPVIRASVEKHWGDVVYGMTLAGTYGDKESAVEAQIAHWLDNPGAPFILEVT